MKILFEFLTLFLKILYTEYLNISIIVINSTSLIFNSKWLFTVMFSLLIIILLCIIYLYEKNKLRIIPEEENHAKIILFFDSFRIKNIYVTLLRLVIYLVCIIVIVLFIRIKTLGKIIDIAQVNIYNYVQIQNLIAFIIFVIFLSIFYFTIEKIFYKDFVRLYFYLYEYHAKSIQWLSTECVPYGLRFNIENFIIYRIHSIVLYAIDEKSRDFRDKLFSGEDDFIRKMLYTYVKTSKTKIKIVKIIERALLYLSQNVYGLICETAWLTVLLALIYDITQQTIYYTYYASFIYLLRILYRKFAKFMWKIDWTKDSQIFKFLYEGPFFADLDKIEKRLDLLYNKYLEGTETIVENKERTDIGEFGLKILDIDGLRRNLLEYLVSNLNRDVTHVDPGDERIRRTRRVIFIVLSMLAIIYIILYRYIEITIPWYNNDLYTINMHHCLVILFCFQIYFWINILRKYYKILFWCTSLFITTFTFLIFLKHNLPLMFNEILFDFGIKFIDFYTTKEKTIFLLEYARYILPYAKLDINEQQYILTLLNYIPYDMLINNSTSIADLKEYVKSLIMYYIHLEYCYKLNIWYLIQDNNNLPTLVEFLPESYKFIRNSIIILGTSTAGMYIYVIAKITYNLTYEYPIVVSKIAPQGLKILRIFGEWWL